MANRTWSDWGILSLLQRIDEGYEPNEEENRVLAERESLMLWKAPITEFPESIGRLTALKRLNLRDTTITELPESIGQLTALEYLSLSGTEITKLPESIGQLTALESLNLFRTKITKLPENIGRLTVLEFLDLSETHITELPESIGLLTALQGLSLSGTKITELPESIGQLTALKSLNLWRLSITELPESIGQLTALESLDLHDSSITELPESIGRLTALEDLGLTGTPIAMLPESIGELSSLNSLALGGTRIAELPESIRRLSKLEKLYLWRTRITELPEWIGELPSLRYLELGRLTLERIPRSLALKGLPFLTEFPSDGRGILVNGTKLLTQDISVFIDTPELIPSLYDEEQVIVPECKVIFLGEGGSGKTYTIKRIKNKGKAETKEEPYETSKTPGIEISDCPVKDENGDFTIHFWDFGGQELYHSMHRCFLTDQTCYVVTVRTREANLDTHARYWLRSVTSMAPECPILLFVNCWDDDTGKKAINESGIRAEFPQIRDVIYCSAKNASQKKFSGTVMKKLFSIAAELKGCNRTIPKSWDTVRRSIMNESKDYLTRERYYELCRKSGIKDANAPELLTFFNNLGVCLSFHQKESGEEVAEYKLLRPIWLTNALYAIIMEGTTFASGGKIAESAVNQLLTSPPPAKLDGKNYTRCVPDIEYKDDEPGFVIDVAASRDLCYRIVDEEQLFFPSLCKKDTPKAALRLSESCPCHAEYRFHYEFLYESILHKLMIRLMKMDLNVRNCWREGMVVGCWNEHRVRISMDVDNNDLCMDVYSKEGKPAYEAFIRLRQELLEVNKAMKIKADEFIVEDNNIFPTETLVNAYHAGAMVPGRRRNMFDPGVLLRKFFDSMTIAELKVEKDGMHIEPYSFHPCPQSNDYLKEALYEVYDHKCRFCRRIKDIDDIEVDHILAKEYLKEKDDRVEFYLAELRSRGFDTKKPDFIENYFPVCGTCNKKKSNKYRDAVTLREFHYEALEKTPKVLAEMEKLRAIALKKKK